MTSDDKTIIQSMAGHAGSSGPVGPLKPPTIPDVVIEQEIGRGGMGVVYRGRQPYIDRRVAVKLLLLGNDGGEHYVKRFQREARILAGLAHPNIVACYQAGVTADHHPYLVMEFVDGPNLRDWINRHGALGEIHALRVVRDLANGLGHANDQGVIHRDVKPENVLLLKRENADPADAFPYIAKLVDLGLARPAKIAGGSAAMNLTMQGVVMGTPATMAPEQFDDPDQVDFRADIYGLGCVFFHAFTGQPAFPSRTLAQIVTSKLSGEVPDPLRLKGTIGKGACDLATAMLAKDRARRPQSYGEIVRRCDDLIAGRQPSRRSAWLLPVAGAAVVALAAATGAMSSTRSDGTEPAAPPPMALPSHRQGASPVPGQTAVEPAAAQPAAAPGMARPDTPAPITPPARKALAPDDVVFAPAQSLIPFSIASVMQGWTLTDHAQWSGADDREGALSGRRESILRKPAPLPWKLTGTLHLIRSADETSGAHTANVGVVLADGKTISLAVKNMSTFFMVTVETAGRLGDAFISVRGPDSVKPEMDLPFELIVTADTMAVRCAGMRIAPVPLPAAPGELFLSANAGQAAQPSGLTPVLVTDLAISYAK